MFVFHIVLVAGRPAVFNRIEQIPLLLGFFWRSALRLHSLRGGDSNAPTLLANFDWHKFLSHAANNDWSPRCRASEPHESCPRSTQSSALRYTEGGR